MPDDSGHPAWRLDKTATADAFGAIGREIADLSSERASVVLPQLRWHLNAIHDVLKSEH